MNMRILLLVLILLCTTGVKGQFIGEFVSLPPSAQNQQLKLPCTHTFQLLAKQGQVLSTGTTLPASGDFTGYFEQSPGSGIMSINHEISPSRLTFHHVNFNSTSRLWNLSTSYETDFSGVVNAYNLCSGGISPWGTLFSAEENSAAGDANGDGYIDRGWLIETNPATGVVIDYGSDGTDDKAWALGRTVHENITFKNDSLTAYFGADIIASGYLYKFVADQKMNFSSGTLYVLKKASLLDSVGTWMVVPNTTIAERNNTQSYATSIAATNFNRIEDVEVGPDGYIYFTSTTTGRIYRLKDNGATINHFEIYVKNQFYTVNTPTGPMSVSWGTGIDNLCFDPQGNLWAFQDGGGRYMWFIDKNHSMASPKISIFGQTPSGAEPTGINFSPDGKYMFMTVQHPSTTNTLVNVDAAGQNVVFNKSTTIVIARREFLGTSIDNTILNLSTDYCINDVPVVLSGSVYSGNIISDGIVNDTLYPTLADTGLHSVSLQYIDSLGCKLYVNDSFYVHALPVVSLSYDSTLCFYDSIYVVGASVSGINFLGLTNDSLGLFNPVIEGVGDHVGHWQYDDAFGCVASDSFVVHVYSPNLPVLSGLDSAYCRNAVVDSLFYSPSSAILTATQGLLGNLFDPSITSVANVQFNLVFTDSLGCTYTSSYEAVVNDPMTNSVSGFGAVLCISHDTIPLTLSPVGGVLNGASVAGNGLLTLNGTIGLNHFTYTTIDSNGCSYTSDWNYTAISPAPVTAGSDDTVCLQVNVYVMHPFPTGGYWQGIFIDSLGVVSLDSTLIGSFEYIYSFTDLNGCLNSDTLQLVVENCTGVFDVNTQNVQVFPNPGDGTFQLTNLSPQSIVTVVDSYGNKIEILKLAESGSTSRFQLKNRAEGVYFITVNNTTVPYLLVR